MASLIRAGSTVLIDRYFLRQKQLYLAQAVLAALTLSIVIAIEDTLTNAAILTAIASSTFIIFMTPSSAMAGPRRVIGGHLVGVCVGLAFAGLIDVLGHSLATNLVTNVFAAIAVGASMLLMAPTDTEHPRAAGTVLGLILGANVLNSAALVLIAAILLSVARALLGRWLIDLARTHEGAVMP